MSDEIDRLKKFFVIESILKNHCNKSNRDDFPFLIPFTMVLVFILYIIWYDKKVYPIFNKAIHKKRDNFIVSPEYYLPMMSYRPYYDSY